VSRGDCFEELFLEFLLQKFGAIKKIVSSLQPQTVKIKIVQRLQLHIDAVNWFSLKGCGTNGGACVAAE
jgi:hypothetical protein